MEKETLLKTPLHAAHLALGARMMPFAGYDMPVQYSGILDEHQAVRVAAGLFDVSHMGEVQVEGPEALAFVQYLVSNDVEKLYDGKAMYATMCRPGGGIVDDLLVYRINQERFLLVINASNIQKDWDWMTLHNTGGAILRNISEETALLALQGPRAFEVFESAFGYSVDHIKYYHFEVSNGIQGLRDGTLISHTGYTGEKGLEIYCDSDEALATWNRLMEAGTPLGLKPAGLGARDTLRLESGYCLYGNDLSDDTSPLEAGLGWITKLEGADFIGRDALIAQKANKPSRKLVGLVVEGKGIPRQGYPILNEQGEEIGIVTSGSQSPLLNQGIGMGFVPNEDLYTTPGNKLGIKTRRNVLSAVIKKPPFHKS